MPFIGNQPALSYTSFAKQDFTTSATTSYTLDHPVTNENEIALFINFVRQEPTTAYTASGTSLTLTSATSATDDMYCVFLGKAVQTVNPPNGSVGTSQLNSSLDFSSKTITLANNMKNTPAFHAGLSSNQSIPNTTTTVIINDVEILDTDSSYDISTGVFTVPSGQAGKYYFYSFVRRANWEPVSRFILSIQKNGVDFVSGDGPINGVYTGGFIGGQVNCSVGDTIRATVYHDDGGANNIFGTPAGSFNFFGGYKIIE